MIELVIFDRDNTLNVDLGFTFKTESLQLMPNILEVKRWLENNSVKFAVASNQSGIGEGYYTENQMHNFNDNLFSKIGWKYEKKIFEFCPHPRNMKPRCICRKPSPYMLLKICEKLSISTDRTVFIGDSETDKEAALKARINFILINKNLGHVDTIEKLNYFNKKN